MSVQLMSRILLQFPDIQAVKKPYPLVLNCDPIKGLSIFNMAAFK